MNETVAPQVVRSYLEQLRTALRDIPEEVSREIIDGISEELAGLDAATAAARIEKLGDPAFIAAEARAGTTSVAELGPTPPVPDDSKNRSAVPVGREAPAPVRAGDPRWYTVLTVLLVAIGGIVVPLLGWIVGIAMVWLSKTWRTWEKWVATLTPLVATVLAALIVAVAYGLFAPLAPRISSGALGSEVSANPLLPTWTDVTMSSVLFLAFVGVVVGVWLLWRALRSDSGRVTDREL